MKIRNFHLQVAGCRLQAAGVNPRDSRLVWFDSFGRVRLRGTRCASQGRRLQVAGRRLRKKPDVIFGSVE